MADRLKGKVACITGGASGLGEATVRRFVEEGAKVVIADIQDDRGQTLAKELGAATVFQHTDVTKEADIAAAVDRAVAVFGRLDIMFNNAGIVGAVGPIDEITAEEYDFTMAILLRGVFLGTKHAARVMKPQGSGVILATSSTAGLMGGQGPLVYATAKTAIVGLTRSAAAELGPSGIRVMAIAPAGMATQMISDVMGMSDLDNLSEVEKALAAGSPLPGRGGRASDIANAALFLASDEAGYISGHVLPVDAGVTSGSGRAPGQFALKHEPLRRERGKRGV